MTFPRDSNGGAMFDETALSDDKFLCGRLRLLQPIKGYRAATDPVFLAAACPAVAGQSVLDIGCGVGAAALCLGWRVPGLDLTGLELQPDYADLARRNGPRNQIALTVQDGDLRQMPGALRRDFDHVITNPPYYPPSGTPSPVEGRAIAMQVDLSLSDWVAACARRVTAGGTLTVICGADGVPEALAGMCSKMGAIALLPLAPREGQPARRVILQGRKGRKSPFRLLAPFVIHAGDSHDGDRESYTPAAEAVLRQGATIFPLLR